MKEFGYTFAFNSLFEIPPKKIADIPEYTAFNSLFEILNNLQVDYVLACGLDFQFSF